VPNPTTLEYDYRERGISHNKFAVTVEGNAQNNNDTVLNSKWTDYNFAPPGTARTVTLISVALSGGVPERYFPSFIELSTPITQYGTDSPTPQYLYVKYTIFFNYGNASGYLPENKYLNFYMNKNLIANSSTLLFGYSLKRTVTLFNEPVTLNNVMRNAPVLATSSDYAAATGARMSRRIEKTFAVADIPGPIGCVCQSESGASFRGILGYSPVNDLTPSISRIFAHPASRISQIFSDPSYPPSSNGIVTIAGTPTPLSPIVGRVKIERTGDASDIIDESVVYSDVDVGANTFTVTQKWATNDILQIDNDANDPPSPLSEAVNYYVIYVSDTTIKLSLTLDGLEIDLLTQGTGNNLLQRQNTGKYSLELDSYPSDTLRLTQFPMAIDKDNKVQPADLYSNTDIGEGGVGWNSDYSFLVRGIFHVSDMGDADNYVYSIQKSRVSGEHTICRWKFWTIESSVALCKFGTSTTKYRAVVKNGTDVYIATDAGIYKYDITAPTVAPALIVITDLIDTNITDLVMDYTTGYMWSGHLTGLSKIDLGTLIATKYIVGVGEQLENMTTNDAIISAGQLSADNGRVMRAGIASMGGTVQPWVLQDGVGWCLVPGSDPTLTRSGTLRKNTDEIVFMQGTGPTSYGYSAIVVHRYSVTVLTKGTGTISLVESFTNVMNDGDTYNTPAYQVQTYGFRMTQTSNTEFIFDRYYRSYYGGVGLYNAIYVVGSGIAAGSYSGYDEYVPVSESQAWRFSIGRNLITVSKDVLIGLDLNLNLRLSLGYPYSYGWNGADWVKDNATVRYIPKTGTQPLLDGLTVAFNNATGKPWDQQFVIGERFTFVYGPMKMKDNLQTMLLRSRGYCSEVSYAAGVSVSVPAVAAYTYHITEAADPNFREVDTYDLVTIVKEGSTQYTQYTLPAGNTFTADYTTGILTVGVNIATGTVVHVSSTGYLPLPLRYKGVYYAINVSPTTIKLALTYADAIATTAINLFDNGISGIHTLYQLAPATEQYFLGMNGVFVFAAADTGKALTLDYTSTYYS
jgi:hypothetical protein